MATKQIRKTKPKSAQAGETKTKSKAPTQASEAKTKASSRPRKSAEAPDKKTARGATRASTKPAGSARIKPVEAATKAKSSRQKTEPAVEAQTSRRRLPAAQKSKTRKHETNGHVAAHARSITASEPRNELDSASATTPGTQRKAVRSPRAEEIFLSLFEALEAHAKSQGIGQVAQDAQFDWGETGNQELSPDLAFVSFERWAPYRHVPKDLTWHVVPDLVVEIVRGSEQTEPISTWLEHYFHAGVNRVWVIYPDQLKIHDHDSLTSSRVIDREQMLDGGAILPGFQMPVKALAAREDGKARR